ncbi:MAG: lactobin A/cerein 7B family class IIb bacteriocin, partial [Pseudohongiellaceae bacterium]
MRELTQDEIEQVGGGFGAVGVVIGAIGGGIAGGINSGNFAGVLSGAALGGVSGFFGGIASVATGFARYSFGGYAVGTSAIGAALG